MKILITGGKGQLGTELCKCFERGHTELGTPEILKQSTEVRSIDVDELDITDLKAVKALFEAEKYDAVINCAAYTNVDGCEAHRDDAFKVNAIGPRNLAIACEDIGAKLIHVSTDYVFRAMAAFQRQNVTRLHPSVHTAAQNILASSM